MERKLDFEQMWLRKFATALDEFAGERVREEVMQGSEELSSASEREDAICWSRQAMERLTSLVDGKQARDVMTSCACQYPQADLRDVRLAYEEMGDVNVVLGMLQEKFETFLRETMHLEDEMIEQIISNGWGSAGVREGDTIVATKIPKSGSLVQYMNEPDPDKKRVLYCHCPRIRDVLKTSQTIPPIYCYCGAGFYKGMWEEILQEPVEVELLESVLKGDQVCKVAIHLPRRFQTRGVRNASTS
jgi:hypothetical protein